MALLLFALASLLATAGGSPAPPGNSGPYRAVHRQDVQGDSALLQPTQQQAAENMAYEAASHDYLASLETSLRKSPYPRDRALATLMMEQVPEYHALTADETALRGALLRGAAEVAPEDVLVQWLWTNATVADSGCDASNPCPQRIEAAARVQPDNGAAWDPVVFTAFAAGNIPAAESALQKMAQATHFDDQHGVTLKAWMEIFQRYPMPDAMAIDLKRSAFATTPMANFDAQTRNFTIAETYAVPAAAQPYGWPVGQCDRSKHPQASQQRMRDCAQVGRVMLTRSTSLLYGRIGRALLRVSGQATATDDANARVEAWQLEQASTAPAPTREDKTVELMNAIAADWLETGDEVQVNQRRVQRAGIPLTPPADWVAHGPDSKPMPPGAHGP